MKRILAYLASATLGAVLIGSGPASAQMRSDIAWRGYPYNSDSYAYNYGYPYNYAYGYGYPYNYAYGYPSSYDYGYGYGYPYANSYGYADLFAIVAAPIAALAASATASTTPVAAAAAPFAVASSAAARLVTGRSVATGQIGKMCSTPVKACELYHASYIGNGCSCRVTGGRSRGTVSP